ncbi:exodeoxyribonuclease V, gamma subunit [Mycobacterium xenopi 3993]|nr:exodeoxyribonuclease V, gamma subunit [Mycobacterium xenopi 3993]
MALHLHRAERTDLLADGLARLLSDPLADPFAEELVLVPARGVERWLSQRLSHVLGRAAAPTGCAQAWRFAARLADRRDHRHCRRRSLVAGGDDLAAAGGYRLLAGPAVV